MTDKILIKELFTSIQGEGPNVGYKQLFVRLCGCNLNCAYCDTDHSQKESTKYNINDLVEIVNKHQDCHSIALTGGEPLLHTGFLREFLPLCTLPVYLETNATLAGEVKEIIDYIDYISADIKLPSATDGNDFWSEHDNFFKAVAHKELYAKIVFDEKITDEEIEKSCKLCAKYGIEIVLQPKTINNEICVSPDFINNVLDKFLAKYKKTRVIPQVHKFIGVR